jgi:hypothetical protein
VGSANCCSECGAPLGAAGPLRGLCPRCLMRRGLDVPGRDPDATVEEEPEWLGPDRRSELTTAEEDRSPVWWPLSRLLDVRTNPGMRRVAAAWVGANVFAVSTGAAATLLDWSGIEIALGGLPLAVTIFPPVVVSLLCAVWLGPAWGAVPIYLANVAGSLAVGIGWTASLAFALAGTAETLMIWGLMVSAGIDPDLRSLRDRGRFLAAGLMAPAVCSLAVLIWNASLGMDVETGQRIWRGWVLGDFLLIAFVTAPLLYLVGPRARAWIRRQIARSPRVELGYGRSAALVFTVFALTGVLVFFGLGLLQASLDVDPATRTRTGELLAPRLAEVQFYLGVLVLALTLALLVALSVPIRLANDNRTLRRLVAEGERIRRDVLARLDREGTRLMRECPACGRCYDPTAEVCPHDETRLTLSQPVGRMLDGKYQLVRALGRGGMGSVYEANDIRLGRTVAVKMMMGAAFEDARLLRRLRAEARSLARIRHPNVVACFDYGEISAAMAGYLVMERLYGHTLRSELHRHGAVPPTQLAEWFDQICEGVKAAHAGGLVHRDLKPENIFLSQERGRVVPKLLDFGLVKLVAPDASGLSQTRSGTVMGTLAYMSPEQLAGHRVDERTDIFALGVVLLECLTGENPLRQRHPAVPEPGPVALPRTIQRPVMGVIERCLEFDPERRYASVDALQADLRPLLRDLAEAHAGVTRPLATTPPGPEVPR